jgi:FdhE protein
MNATTRLDAIAQTHPEWTPWLCVLREVVTALSDPVWDSDPLFTMDTAAPSALAPLLGGAQLQPKAHAVTGLLKHLHHTAQHQGLHSLIGAADSSSIPARKVNTNLCHGERSGAVHGGAPDRPPPDDDETEQALTLFLAALNGDDAVLDQLAIEHGATPEGFRALAALLPMPYLHACARQWSASPHTAWSQGYCPVCGAWPAFAEVRGIERSRHLLCGRCAASWAMPVLACTYCGTIDHEQLGTLVVDDKTARFSVDVCHQCSGYLKSCTTLQATPADSLLAVDLASAAFDLVALERGFLRPPGFGVTLQATLAADLSAPVTDTGTATNTATTATRSWRWWS